MVESHAYLRNVEQLIKASRSPHLLRSTSIRMLHSTFLYLWTLQARVRAFGTPRQELQTQLAPNQIFDYWNPTTHSDVWEQLIPVVIESDDDDDDDSPSSQGTVSIFEQVYSVSETLFRLIGRVTSFASEVGNHEGTINRPLHNLKEVAELEDAICSWKNDFVGQEPVLASNGGNVRFHFQNAIHSALLIYFYKCVRVVDTYVMQPHVEKTISHLQLYTEAKRQSGDQSSSICWPGFVAACEALDRDLRQRFSQWFLDETAQTGIRMFATAGAAVKQVWDARDRSNNRNLPWSKILQSDDIIDQLMLS
jgi:arginine metabolism regulation protein II